ncbi:MAG: hypothetical protein IPF51_04195 [Dehalococcoidia bacterium]|nr:hypothetical protein [Dehalococcoidia bacterium]
MIRLVVDHVAEGGLEVRVTARTPGQSTLVEATAIQALVAQGMQRPGS